MSDINIIPDGFIAFLAAVILCLLLLVGIAICTTYGLAKASRKRERFISQGVFPHLFGMALSLMSAIAIMLLMWSSEMSSRLRALNRWLDNWIWLWIPAILALWPLGVILWKKWRGKRSTQSAGET